MERLSLFYDIQENSQKYSFMTFILKAYPVLNFPYNK